MKTSKIVLILLLAMVLFALGCGTESNDSSPSRSAADDATDGNDDDNFTQPSNGDDDDESHPSEEVADIFSDALPIDACITDDGSIWVAYAYDGQGSTAVNAFVRYDALHRVDWVYPGSLSFPHTLDCRGNMVLLADIFLPGLVLVDSSTLESIEISFVDWDDTVTPNAAELTDDGNILVSNLYSNTIMKITMTGEELWEYMVTTESPGLFSLHGPIELSDRHLLYCLSDLGRVEEVDSAGNLIWFYDQNLILPKSVQRLDNGDTLIVDHERIIEVNQAKQIVWEFDLPCYGFNAERLANGNTLNGTSQVLMISPDGMILWTLGGYSNILDESIIQQNKRLQMMRSIGYL